MPKVSSKRQITLPLSACKELGITPGDDIEVFVYKNQFNIIKIIPGAAKGILKGIKTDSDVTDKESLEGNFE